MEHETTPRRSITLLDVSALFIIPGVGIPMLWDLFAQDHPNRWIASALLALYTVILLLRERIISGSGRWRPFAYIAVQTLVVVCLLWLPPGQVIAVVLFFVLSAEVTMMFSERMVIAWITLFILITILAYATTSNPMNLLAVPIYAAGYIFFATFARQTARAEAARAESQALLQQLQDAHQQLQAYAAQAERLAVAEERNRLAREMHDTLGHRLTVSSVQLQAAERLIATDPDRATAMIGTVREQVRQALAELRQTVATLRAALEADLPLQLALQQLAASFEQATGIVVHTDIGQDLSSLPQPHRLAIYRGAQEGLTNIQKHAQASEAWLSVQLENEGVHLLVEDNGLGASVQDTELAFGLRGLQERANRLGGTLSFGPGGKRGAKLSLYTPVPSPIQLNGDTSGQPKEQSKDG